MKKQILSDKYAIGYIYKKVGSHDYTNVGPYDFRETFRQNVVNAVGRTRYDRGEGYYVLFEDFSGNSIMITEDK